ncbi:MAG: sigma-54-dependent Fis family transcriptional regulator [Desulfobacterales bacterium]|nr:sigma-54-dependent Fis family transcriptional regulator [Desulfobacterales bacterium]
MKILIVDDEDIQRTMLKGFLQKQGYDVIEASNGATAIKQIVDYPVSIVLLDHKMPDMNGDEVLSKIKAINPFVRSIMITAYASVDTAVTIMKLGADDFLEKPVDLKVLLEKIQFIEQAFLVEEEAHSVINTLTDEELPIHVIGQSKAMKETLSLTRRIAATEWTVLIRGETGTGKELIARLIHQLSVRQDKPFIEVNCAAIPENLFESELFGHEKGAFTSANNTRRGRFELAREGTIFLDEIGELPLNLQPKLLRALQEKRISRVGSEKEIPIDVRVIAATNRDLKRMVEVGQFREDLYYRLNVFDITLPALRQRKEDIPLLAEFFMSRYAQRPIHLSSEATDMLIKYSFPGNVRELEHLIQRTVTLARSNVIHIRDLPEDIRFYQATVEQGTLFERLNAVERVMMFSALEKNEWVQTKAADMLGISERVLRYKMKKHGIQKI